MTVAPCCLLKSFALYPLHSAILLPSRRDRRRDSRRDNRRDICRDRYGFPRGSVSGVSQKIVTGGCLGGVSRGSVSGEFLGGVSQISKRFSNTNFGTVCNNEFRNEFQEQNSNRFSKQIQTQFQQMASNDFRKAGTHQSQQAKSPKF